MDIEVRYGIGFIEPKKRLRFEPSPLIEDKIKRALETIGFIWKGDSIDFEEETRSIYFTQEIR